MNDHLLILDPENMKKLKARESNSWSWAGLPGLRGRGLGTFGAG
jgi:hypothetical protein